ncbi:MAG: hypothetical protein ACKPAE_22780, partial [Microcystis panniformis]
MVRSPKLIAGSVGLALGNAPYKISDRTASGAVGATLGNAPYGYRPKRLFSSFLISVCTLTPICKASSKN